jgi:hypothetical protein
MTKNVIRKTVAIITALTIWASAAGPALALTAEELQAQINTLMAQLATLQSQLAALQGGGTGAVTCTITSFTRNLKQGMSGDDVKCLQIVLNSDTSTQLAPSGVGSSGSETTYFGPLTKAAVIKFQEKYASEVLASWGLTSGTGFVGSTTRAKLDTFLTDGGVTPPTDGEVGTAATVSLASDTPVAGSVALNAQDVIMTKLKFTAGADAYTVTKIVVARGGVSADADVSSIGIYDGSTRLGSLQALNTNTHKATFSSLSWQIPSYGVKYLTIKASIAASSAATVGDSIQLGIASASDITSSVTLSGVFPMMGNTKTIAGISVGNLDVDVQTTPATSTMLSGAVDQEIACWRFSASGTEGFTVHSIRISHAGNASRGDLSNLVLKVAGTQIGSTIAELDASNQANFDLSASPLSINAGTSKTVCAYADIAAGIWTSREIKFEITQYTDVVAYGANSGGVTTITYNTGTSFVKQTGSTMTIGQGTLSVALDAAENPSNQSYVKGTTNRLMLALKFSTASTEGVRLTKLRFTLSGNATNISNVTLWDGTTQIAGPASVIGSYVTFGANTVGWDTTGLFDMEASKTKTILVKADIPTGATNNATLVLSLAGASDVWADGLNSQYDLPSGSVAVTSVTGSTMTVSSNGSLAVSLASNSPAAQTYVKGSTAKVFTKINLTAGTGEDITVSSITIRCYRSDDTATACSSGDTSNVKILKSDGTQYGVTRATVAASASFSGNLTVAAGQTETLSVVADVPTTSNATSAHWDLPGAQNVYDEITSYGVSSGGSFNESGSATGKSMTFGQGSLTISAAATPADQTLIIGASEVPFVGLVMTAGTGEDVRVTRVVLKRSVAASGAAADASNIALWEGNTRLTIKKAWDTADTTEVTFTASDFLNSTGITITKGQQKTITVKADLPSTGTANHKVALGIATSSDPGSSTTTEVTIVGLASNTSPAPTLVKAATTLEGVNYSSESTADSNVHLVTLASSGILTLARSADTPLEQIQSVSIEGIQIPGVSFLKAYLKSSLERIKMKSITIERKGGAFSRDDDFASISIYDGNGNLIAAPQALSNASTTFNLVPDDGDGVWEQGEYWTVPTVGTVNLIVKATLNGIASYYGYGSRTGDVPTLCVDNTTAEGVDSGSSPSSGAGVPSSAICSNVQIIRQGQPTIALASPTSETYGAGQKELLRWTVSADQLSSIVWEKVIFDLSGGVVIGTDTYTVGSAPDTASEWRFDGVYMSTSTTIGDAVPVQLIATTSMQVWDVNTNTQISATSTATGWTVDQETSTGTARISFVANAEQEVAANGTKTYKLLGNILRDGIAGSAITTKIDTRSTATTTGNYPTLAATDATFVWSDNSGASAGSHSAISADWTNDYKVSGLPTATKSLAK